LTLHYANKIRASWSSQVGAYKSELTTRSSQLGHKIEDYAQQGATSLQLQRVAAEFACDTFRVHAVDVRDQGYMLFALSVSSDMPDNIRRDVTRCYSITLQQNLQYTLKLARSSIAKEIDASKQISLDNALVLGESITALENTDHGQDVFDAYTKLVDIYMFPRMCRKDNSNVLFFYGGQIHAERAAACARQLPKSEVLFSYIDQDDTATDDKDDGANNTE
jgi:hypothetical protein